MIYDVIIIGAGPAGLMATTQCQNKKVLIFEKKEVALKKLLLTGGGRCNITNNRSVFCFLDQVSYQKKYLYSTLTRFGPSDIIFFFENLGIPLKEEADNKVFPVSNQAKTIRDALLNQLLNVPIHYQEAVQTIIPGDLKTVITEKGQYTAKNVIIASGGASFPSTGSTGDHMKWADALNIPTIPLFPAETSIIVSGLSKLAGTAIEEVEVHYEKRTTTGNLMFTHKGLSGSSIMTISEYIARSNTKEIAIDFLPHFEENELLKLLEQNRENEPITFLTTYFTRRFCQFLVDQFGYHQPIKQLTKAERIHLIQQIKSYPFKVKAVAPLDEAYVTGGGIDLNHVNMMTMESNIHPGIYIVGEALDIHGPIGGYNLTLALSTGYTAGYTINNTEPI